MTAFAPRALILELQSSNILPLWSKQPSTPGNSFKKSPGPCTVTACVSPDWWPALLPRLPFLHLPDTHDSNLAMEFDDSWVEGLIGPAVNEWAAKSQIRDRARKTPELEDTVKRCLNEPSNRGIAVRAYWAWVHGTLPRQMRIWLIDGSGQLPADYELGGGGDSRDRWRDFPTSDNFAGGSRITSSRTESVTTWKAT